MQTPYPLFVSYSFPPSISPEDNRFQYCNRPPYTYFLECCFIPGQQFLPTMCHLLPNEPYLSFCFSPASLTSPCCWCCFRLHLWHPKVQLQSNRVKCIQGICGIFRQIITIEFYCVVPHGSCSVWEAWKLGSSTLFLCVVCSRRKVICHESSSCVPWPCAIAGAAGSDRPPPEQIAALCLTP